MAGGRLQRKSDALNCAVLGFVSLIIYIFVVSLNERQLMEEAQVLEQSAFSPPEYHDNYHRHFYEREFMNHFPFATKEFLAPPPGRSISRLETNRIFVALEEVLQMVDYENPEKNAKKTYIIEYSTRNNKKQLVILQTSSPTLVMPEHYTRGLYKPRMLKLGDHNSHWETKNKTLQKVTDYFDYLHTVQAQCRKLVRLGGSLFCQNVGDENRMDGHKLVCFDPELEIPGGRDPRSCLVFSYGIATDITFDDSVSLLPCEIHMFDMVNLNLTHFLSTSPHAYFHEVGISDVHIFEFFLRMNKTFTMDTLTGQVMKNKLIGRPMHILKMDIENNEWKVLKSLLENPFLDLIGQIALEVHAFELVNKTVTEQLEFLQYRYDILRGIEARGFRMVAYWDNHQKAGYKDENGTHHDVCGELLYVNSNWYNVTHKATLRSYGFSFKNSS